MVTSGIHWYCHGDSFRINETWYSQNPVFSSCLYNSVFYMPLSLYVAVYVPIRILILLLNPKRRINLPAGTRACPPWNIVSGLQLFFMVTLLHISVLKYHFSLQEKSWDITALPPVDIMSHSLEIVTFIIGAIFLCWHRQLAIHTSPSLAFITFFYCVASSFHFVLTFTQRSTFSSEQVYLVYAQFAAGLCNFISQWFSTYRPSSYTRLEESGNDDENEKPNACLYASATSRLTFHWVNDLVIRGWRTGSLTVDDITQMLPNHRSKYIHTKFSRIWAKLRHSSVLLVDDDAPRTVLAHQTSQSNLDHDDSLNENSIGISDQQPIIAPVDEEPVLTQQKKGNVFIVLIRAYGVYYLVGAIASVFLDICVLTTPIVLRSLLTYLEDTEKSIVWHGYLIVISFFLVTQSQSFLQNFFYYRLLNVAVLARSGLVTMIYRKSLKIGNPSRGDSSTGQIVNLMSVDADRFTSFLTWSDVMWSAPMRVGVSIYFIYQELGASIFAGLGVIVFLIPCTTFISRFMEKEQKIQMKSKDERIKLIGELLNGIRVVKLYAWEKSFTQLIRNIRNIELSRLRRIAYCEALTTFVFTSTPMLVALSSFLTYILSDSSHKLDAKKAFVSLAFFNIMRLPLTNLPFLFVQAASARVSIGRLNRFLNLPDLQKYVTHNKDKYVVRITAADFGHGKGVSIEDEKDKKKKQSNGTVTLSNGNAGQTSSNNDATDNKSTEPFELKNINVKIKEASLIAIVGRVGAGKSSLVSAILGEMEKTRGSVNITPGNSIAYVPQQAWIQNDTLKNNILFGQPYDETKYRQIISACQLLPDLEILPSGDLTEIGEKGINLSGGQKQRLALARACYSNAKLFILDDPLSAVDAHVAKNLYNEIISSQTGLLGKKTRILVTNDISMLPKVDHIYVLSDGKITESGKYDQLIAADGHFARFVSEFSTKRDEETASPSPTPDKNMQLNQSPNSKEKSSEQSQQLSRNKEESRLITDEQLNTEKISLRVYLIFMRNIALIPVSIFCVMLTQAFDAGDNYWLSLWASDGNTTDAHLPTYRITVYSGLGFGQIASILCGALVFARGSIICASKMHSDLLRGILRAPMSFFDTTPCGRIVNRFSKDIDTIDSVLPDTFNYWILILIQTFTTFSMMIFVSPLLALVIFSVSILYYFIQKAYIPTNRQLRRILSVTRSPVYSNFSETLTGLTSIRAYHAQSRFITNSDKKLDITQAASLASVSTNRWLSTRLQFIGNVIIFSAALISFLERDKITPALAGLSITYAMSTTQILNWLIMMTAGLETNIVSVERVVEFSELKSEAEWDSPDEQSKPPAEWPTNGEIQFKSYSTRYRENLDLVLKDLTFTINGGEKVGIVGRTGAGKSSIALSIFRLIEPASGTIIIDGVDITKIGLHELRDALTIIPQDPVLFSGKLRINLDPFNRHPDDRLWKALELAHLQDFVRGLDGGLDYEISEGGANLSVGQRQLVCLARALLKNTKILVLDEATAAVDLQTDSLIQSTVRSEFSNCTILTIAHRLNTIMDSDKILVLANGSVAEFAPPKQLLEDETSQFHSLAKDARLI